MSEKKQFAFTVMSFDESFDDVYKLGIRAACEETNVICQRVDEQIFQEIILERIANQIRSADFLIADVTGRNANVFFEIGFALALKKKVILIARKAEDIPFDLKPFSHVVYGSSISNLKAELIRRIPEFLARKDGYTIGQEVVTAPRPDVRIQVQNGFIGYDLSTPMLSIQAPNHSPGEVYLGNFFLYPRKGGIALVMQDGATGRFQGRVVLKPGEGHTFYILASALFQDSTPEDYVLAGVRDEIGRENTSTEEELASALRIVFRSFSKARNLSSPPWKGGRTCPRFGTGASAWISIQS